MAPRESELRQLIGLTYEAAENPALWPEFLKHYAHSIGANLSVIQVHHLAERTSRLLAAFGLASPLKESYHAHYSRVNIWRDSGRIRYIAGRVMLDEELLSRSLLERSEFYNDYLVKIGGVYGATAVIDKERDNATVLTALRNGSQRPFDESERTAIEMLLPHLIRANKVQKSLRLLEAQDAVLDTLDLGVAFVSGTGELISCNRTTDDILLAGDGFSIREGRLRANDSVANARLQAVLRSTVSATPAIDCPAVVAVPRSSLKRPYQVTAAHLPNGLPAFAGMQLPQVVLLIVDPELQHPPAREALIHLFGLTPREAALASALSTGRTINEAADDLRMTYETARSHLRRIFGKTNTSRQTELILLLARLPKQRAADSEA